MEFFPQKRSLKEWNWKNAEKGLPLPHKTKSLMEKTTERKKKSIFQRVLDDKRAIRQCIQKGGRREKSRGRTWDTIRYTPMNCSSG